MAIKGTDQFTFPDIQEGSSNDQSPASPSSPLNSEFTPFEEIKITETSPSSPSPSKNFQREFIEDYSVLNSVEGYSQKVRDEADSYAKKIRDDVKKQKLEAEEIKSQIILEREKVEIEAERLISEAHFQKEEILQQAKKEGEEAGHASGYLEALTQSKEHVQNIKLLLKDISVLKTKMMMQHEEELIKMVMILARMVVKNELKTNPAMVLGGIKTVLKKFEGLGKIKIRLNPVDIDYFKETKEELANYLEEGQNISIRSDSSIAAGSSMIESDFSLIDQEFKRQFAILDDEIIKCFKQRKQLYQNELDKIGSPPQDPA